MHSYKPFVVVTIHSLPYTAIYSKLNQWNEFGLRLSIWMTKTIMFAIPFSENGGGKNLHTSA